MRACTVCSHPKRQTIDASLVRRVPKSHLALDYALTESAIGRHARAHIHGRIAAAAVAREIKAGGPLLEQLTELQGKAVRLLDEAAERGKYVAAASLIAEARQCLALAGKVTGELNDRPQVNVLVTSPEWASLQARIVEALRPYPEAMEAVAAALGERAAARLTDSTIVESPEARFA